MRRTLVLLVGAVCCASCAARGASARGPKVVQTTAPPAGCAPLGPIAGADASIEVNKPWEHLQIGPSKAAAVAAALAEAEARGATHASLGEPRREERGFSVAGTAWDCSSSAAAAPGLGSAPPPAAAPASSPPGSPAAAADAPPPPGLGCFKDTDCKGDRICRSRVCVDP